ncbi:hypothetical protein TcasGA2_TC009282 [Tribolium castaneum]|uniref:G-protein coupled receptors family 2 profile 2 domain-containing protein n=2 Tax=Tribolium castaneum TaxID=7070 RepID=D6WS12_TRICA|nr:hypothetical protein TcasGA2_TC009282 [Tribolium castaneum]
MFHALKLIPLFCTFLISPTLQTKCVSVRNNATGIEWPSTRNRALSRPICLNQNQEFVYRTCVNGNWDSEPFCYYTQPEKLPECPDGFNETETTCYKLSEKSEYPPKCDYPQTLPFSFYKEIVDLRIRVPVWVPASRDLHNGLGLVQWTEPSNYYKTEVSYKIAKSAKHHCVTYYNKTFTLTSCQEEHFGVCAYLKLNQLVDNVCESDFYCLQGDFNDTSKCICKRSTMVWVSYPVNYPQAEFPKPYQYSVYGRLTNETCAMGLVKSPNGRYIWRNSGQELEYTFWSKNVDFTKSHQGYAAATPEGWILTRGPTRCALFELEVKDLEPSLSLSFNPSTNKFLLEVANSKRVKFLYFSALIFCFTDADLTLVYRYPALNALSTGERLVLQFDPFPLPGNYWCEAFKFVDLGVIQTIYFHRPVVYPEFVTIISVRYDKYSDPLSSDFVTKLNQSELFHSLRNNLYIQTFYQLRIMKIIDLDEDTSRVTVNVHLSSNFGNSSFNETFQYETIKHVVSQAISGLKTEQIDLVDFLSSDFCPNESNRLTWPQTPVNSTASPDEFCLTSNGSFVTRWCLGDFVDGAKWLHYENCVIYPKSNITRQLLMIMNYSKSSLLDTLFNLSANYREFEPVDVYLFGEMFNGLDNITSGDLVLFAKTVNNLLKIDRKIARQAQLELGASDKFLELIENFTRQCKDSSETWLNNFVLVSVESGYLSGLVVEKQDEQIVVRKLTDDHSVPELTKSQNLEYAIWLSPKTRQKIPHDEKVTFWLFLDDSFFQQTVPGFRTGPVFGILHPEGVTFTADAVRVLRRVTPNQKVDFCGKWSYSSHNRGFWERSGQIKDYEPFVLCEFGEAANFGLVSFNDDNVTDDLIDLLDSNDTVTETLDKLSHISERYEQFKPIDVAIVGQILGKVNYDEEIDLEILAVTVSNLHEIDRGILSDSQRQDRSTDSILANVDIILQNQKIADKVQITAQNFIVFIAYFTKTFNGLVLLKHEGVLEPIILEGNLTIDDVAKYNCFDSAVVLSPELKKQISEKTKIIITVFFNDALFNEKTNNNKVSNKIFGVIIVPPLGKYHGPVSIYHKLSETVLRDCVFWNYSHNIPGSWQNDTKAQNDQNLTRCDFWHTTHFGQLLLEGDKFRSSIEDSDILSIITNINCMVSLIGLAFIILTAVIFKRWRENTGNQILLNFTFVIIVQIAIFYISNSVNAFHKDYVFCTIIGVSLHYSIISQFCWMLVIAVLQFRRFVTVLEGPPRYILLKASISGWVLPLFPVLAVFISDESNYVNSSAGLCYPSGLGLYLGVWLPVALIVLINSVIFTVTLYNVVHKKTEVVFNGHNEALYQWRLAVMLFFMLGLTWCFGFLAKLDVGLVFEYLFCITATLQGFTIFLFFIVFNVNTRYLYIGVINKYCNKINN